MLVYKGHSWPDVFLQHSPNVLIRDLIETFSLLSTNLSYKVNSNIFKAFEPNGT